MNWTGFFAFWGVCLGVFAAFRIAWITVVGGSHDHRWSCNDIWPHRIAALMSVAAFSVAILIGAKA